MSVSLYICSNIYTYSALKRFLPPSCFNLLHMSCLKDSDKTNFYITPVVFKPVLQAPLPCTFCMSPLSDTANSGLAVSTNVLMS